MCMASMEESLRRRGTDAKHILGPVDEAISGVRQGVEEVEEEGREVPGGVGRVVEQVEEWVEVVRVSGFDAKADVEEVRRLTKLIVRAMEVGLEAARADPSGKAPEETAEGQLVLDLEELRTALRTLVVVCGGPETNVPGLDGSGDGAAGGGTQVKVKVSSAHTLHMAISFALIIFFGYLLYAYMDRVNRGIPLRSLNPNADIK